MNLTTYESYRVFEPSKAQVAPDYIARVNASISSVSAKFAALLGRQVEIGETEESFTPPSGSGLHGVSVQAYPIQSVDSITFDSVELATDEFFVSNSKLGRIVFTPSLLRATLAPGYVRNSVRITYTGGMAADTADFIQKYPDIVAEVNAQIRFELSRISTIAETSQTANGETSNLAEYDLIPSAKRIIKKYRRKAGIL